MDVTCARAISPGIDFSGETGVLVTGGAETVGVSLAGIVAVGEMQETNSSMNRSVARIFFI
jgi:hypothetical protein